MPFYDRKEEKTLEQERKELLNNESEDRAKNKTGLVLEGGGMRGIYTAGVLDVFLDEGLEFDGVIGVSAGAAGEKYPVL